MQVKHIILNILIAIIGMILIIYTFSDEVGFEKEKQSVNDTISVSITKKIG